MAFGYRDLISATVTLSLIEFMYSCNLFSGLSLVDCFGVLDTSCFSFPFADFDSALVTRGLEGAGGGSSSSSSSLSSGGLRIDLVYRRKRSSADAAFLKLAYLFGRNKKFLWR
jgi:hypothetical protein